MARWLDWWHRVTGGNAAAPHPARTTPKARPKADREAPGELSLAKDAHAKRTSQAGKAGFDPYSSDGGYAKPHSWERVDHD